MEDDLYGIGPMITHDLPIIREYNAVQHEINQRRSRAIAMFSVPDSAPPEQEDFYEPDIWFVDGHWE